MLYLCSVFPNVVERNRSKHAKTVYLLFLKQQPFNHLNLTKKSVLHPKQQGDKQYMKMLNNV